MPRRLLPASYPSELFTDILTFTALSFFATLTAGVSAYKIVTWRGEKLVLMASRFAAGVFLGTAMMDLLSESDIFFHWLGLRYPMAFLFSCTGYGVAMLVDCLLARSVRRLSRGCFKKFRLKSFDKFILSLVNDLESTNCCDTTVPAGTSKSETKDCDGIGYLRYLILYRATLIVDFLFLLYPLSVLSTVGGTEIGSAETKTLAWRAFLNATLHNVIYMVSLVFTGLRFIPSIRFIVCLFFMVLFSTLIPIGTMIPLLIWNNESSLGSEPGELDNEYWTVGIFFGLLSGILVYLSVHHLLADGYELERSVSGTRFGKFVAMVAGVGLVALLKVLDM